MRTVIAVVVLGALVPGAAAVAAEGQAGGRRLRVRVSAPGVLDERVVGEVLAADEETLTIETRDRRIHVIPVAEVTRVELRRKTGGKGRAIKIGALTGLAVGVVVGFVAGEDCGASDAPSLVCIPREGAALGVGLTGALVGAGIGAVIVPSERWEVVRYKYLTAGITTPSPHRREVGVFVAARF